MIFFVESDAGYSPMIRMKQPATGVRRKVIKQFAPPPDDTPELHDARPTVKLFYLGTMETGQKVDRVVKARRGENHLFMPTLPCILTHIRSRTSRIRPRRQIRSTARPRNPPRPRKRLPQTWQDHPNIRRLPCRPRHRRSHHPRRSPQLSLLRRTHRQRNPHKPPHSPPRTPDRPISHPEQALRRRQTKSQQFCPQGKSRRSYCFLRRSEKSRALPCRKDTTSDIKSPAGETPLVRPHSCRPPNQYPRIRPPRNRSRAPHPCHFRIRPPRHPRYRCNRRSVTPGTGIPSCDKEIEYGS